MKRKRGIKKKSVSHVSKKRVSKHKDGRTKYVLCTKCKKRNTPRRGIGRENTRPNLIREDAVLNPGLLRDREGF